MRARRLGVIAAVAAGLLAGAPGVRGAASPGLRAQAEVSARKVYVGQEIVYTARVTSASPLGETSLRPPPFTGFAARGLPPPVVRAADGSAAHSAEVQYLLVAKKPGSAVISPAVFTCRLEGSDGSSPPDPFFEPRSSPPVDVETPPVAVRVLPRPAYGGPGDFSGLVGAFDLAATLSPAEVVAGRSAGLVLTLRGRGTGDPGFEPVVETPPEVLCYPESPEGTPVFDASGSTLRAVFRYAVVPSRPGRFRLGPFSLVAFDPTRGRYERIEAPSVSLLALGEATFPAAKPAAPASPPPLQPNPKVPAEPFRLTLPRFLALLAAPVLLRLLVSATAKRMRERALPVAAAARASRRRLREGVALAARGDVGALAALHHALRWAELVGAGGGPELSGSAIRVRGELESARFGGGLPPNRDSLARLVGDVSEVARALLGPRPFTLAPLTCAAALSVCLAVVALGGAAPPGGIGASGGGPEALARASARDPGSFVLPAMAAEAYAASGDAGRAALWRERSWRRQATLGAATGLLGVHALFWGVATLRGRKKTAFAATAVLVAAALTGTCALEERFTQRAVIVAPDVTARSGLSAETTELFRLRPGELVTVDRRLRGFARVRANDERLGWVPAGALAEVRSWEATSATGLGR